MEYEAIFENVKKHVFERLKKGLAADLYYHGLGHTKDVLRQAERIAGEEGVTDKEELFLLRLACLYHDYGFLFTYKGHEERGFDLARQELAMQNLSIQQLDRIGGMIMATHLPQSPKNLLEQIICDADLDYLGRDDAPEIAGHLFSEMRSRGMIDSEREWNLRQITFLKEHHYFTASQQKNREAGKQEYLAMLQSRIN